MITQEEDRRGKWRTTLWNIWRSTHALSCSRNITWGRVAFVQQADGLPVIMPVNYLMRGEAVVIRIDPNRRLGGAVRSTTAAFEIDGIDDRERTGWSVVVTGRAEEVVDPEEVDELRQTPLLPWARRS
jgi:uncharacterized protein